LAQATLSKETELARDYRGDLTRYVTDCLVIKTKAGVMVPFKMNRAQMIVHERLGRQLRETGRVRAIILKARQEGISTYAAARFFRRVTMYPNQSALIVADQKKRGSVLFDIYENFDRRLPDWIKPQKRFGTKGNQIVYDTHDASGLNSRVTVETAMDAAAGRGSTIQAIHASEMAFWEKPEDVWVALMQAVPDQGSEVIIESTANGVGNFFHRMWDDAVSGENGYEAIFLPWWVHEEYELRLSPDTEELVLTSLTDWEREALEVGIEYEGELHRLTPGQLAWRRQTIRDKLSNDERAFRQEYPSTAREAFLVSGNMFFDEDALLRMEQETRAPLRCIIRSDGQTIAPKIDARGPLRIWEMPEEGGHYVIFADTATGKQVSQREQSFASDSEKGGRDFSSADVLKVFEYLRDENGAIVTENGQPVTVSCRKYVAQLHGRIPPEVFAKQVRELGYIYGNPRAEERTTRDPALLGVERNHSSGETVLRILKDDFRYPRLYYHRLLARRSGNRPGTVAGWQTTTENRQQMLDDLAGAFRDGSVEYFNPDGVKEFFTFVRGESGKPEAQEGCHDDRVISAAGALQLARYYQRPARGRAPAFATSSSPTGLFDY
jgi:hypothetical protein